MMVFQSLPFRAILSTYRSLGWRLKAWHGFIFLVAHMRDKDPGDVHAPWSQSPGTIQKLTVGSRSKRFLIDSNLTKVAHHFQPVPVSTVLSTENALISRCTQPPSPPASIEAYWGRPSQNCTRFAVEGRGSWARLVPRRRQ